MSSRTEETRNGIVQVALATSCACGCGVATLEDIRAQVGLTRVDTAVAVSDGPRSPPLTVAS